jgi:hypothetical protein
MPRDDNLVRPFPIVHMSNRFARMLQRVHAHVWMHTLYQDPCDVGSTEMVLGRAMVASFTFSEIILHKWHASCTQFTSPKGLKPLWPKK